MRPEGGGRRCQSEPTERATVIGACGLRHHAAYGGRFRGPRTRPVGPKARLNEVCCDSGFAGVGVGIADSDAELINR
jgi:hypothetical protein